MNIFSQLVDEDTASAWSDLFDSLQNSMLSNKDALFAAYGIGGEMVTEQQFRSAAPGYAWAELADGFFLDFEIMPGSYESTPWAGAYFAPAVDYIVAAESESYPKYFLAERSWIEQPWQSLPDVNFPFFSYAVISCPRCEMLWKQEFGEDVEFDRDSAADDCVSCRGTGEWVFDT
jgi:hypothetical protein